MKLRLFSRCKRTTAECVHHSSGEFMTHSCYQMWRQSFPLPYSGAQETGNAEAFRINSRQMVGLYLNTGSDRFLPHILQYATHKSRHH
jgi:hypothetical protein